MSRVQFNPHDMGGFVRLPTGESSILLAIDCFEAVDRGTRVHAMFGSPYSSAMRGVTLRFRYRRADGLSAIAAAVIARIDIVHELPAGSWTRAAFLLPFASPQSLVALEATAAHTPLSFLQPWQPNLDGLAPLPSSFGDAAVTAPALLPWQP